jgi:hypothetical protein
MNYTGLNLITLIGLVALSSGCATVCTTSCPTRPMASYAELIQGKDMSNWAGDTGTWVNAGGAQLRAGDPKALDASDGSGVIVNGPDGRTHNLISTVEHGDCILELDFMVPKGSNSGVYLQARYEIQVLDSYGVPADALSHSDCGGIYQRYLEGHGYGYQGTPPRMNASKAPGEWQHYEIWFKAPRFDANGRKTSNAKFIKVLHNGQVQHENVEVTGPTRAATWRYSEAPMAPLMLQGDHGPVAYRNIHLTPADFSQK